MLRYQTSSPWSWKPMKPSFVFTTAVQQQFVSQRPFVFAEFAVIQHFLPLLCPQMIFNNRFIVLIVNYRTFVAHDLAFVPFTERFRVLRLSRDHVIQGSRLAVAVFTQLGVRMVCIVEYLIFRSRDIRSAVRRLPGSYTVRRSLNLYLLSIRIQIHSFLNL